jgi:hypothetical protein
MLLDVKFPDLDAFVPRTRSNPNWTSFGKGGSNINNLAALSDASGMDHTEAALEHRHNQPRCPYGQDRKRDVLTSSLDSDLCRNTKYPNTLP